MLPVSAQAPPGSVRIPADLDSVTTVGDEDYTVVGPAATQRIWSAARDWYAAGMHPAIQVCLRVDGKVVLNRAIGHGWGNAPDDPPDAEKIPVRVDTPFCAYSTAKAIAGTVVHMLVERGAFSLDDLVTDYLPDYGRHGKGRTTIRHVLTHTAGVPIATGGNRKIDISRADDSDYAREQLARLRPVYPPGALHMYHALTWGPLIREIVRAAAGRDIREILATEILEPLGFRWSNFGVTPADVPLVAPSHPTGLPLPAPVAAMFRVAIGGTVHEIIPVTNKPRFLTSVIPSSNLVSTAEELCRFAEIWRNGGELDGVRVFSPQTLAGATKQTRWLRPDIAGGLHLMRWGTGFILGTRRFGPFGKDAPRAFGGLGIANVAVWADPARGLAGGIISSGKPGRDVAPKRYPTLMNTITAEIGVRDQI